MRITIVNDGYRNCGGGLQLLKYANQMSALGHEVTLAYQYNFTFDLIPVLQERIYAPAMSPEQLPDADIILHSSWSMARHVAGLPESKGIPVSFILGFEQWSGSNEDIISCWRLPVYKIAPSKYLQEQMWLHSGLTWPVIPFGIDFTAFHPEEGRTAPTPGNHTVGALYNNGPTKRMPDLIATLTQLHRERPEVGIELFGFDERPDLDFPFNYVCQPSTDELRAMMNRCHVWLSMSDQEGLHVPPMEAMACGAVPVSSDIGGTRDYCLDRYNGLRFPVGNTNEAARSVLTLMDDPQLWELYAGRSLECIRSMGTEEDNVRKVLAYFEQILGERDRGHPGLFDFTTFYGSSVATLGVYLEQAEKLARMGEAAQALNLTKGVVQVMEEQAVHKGGDRYLSIHGAMYGRALAMSQAGQPFNVAGPVFKKAAFYNPADTTTLEQAYPMEGKTVGKVHDNGSRFDGHIRAYPTLACNLNCPYCVNQQVVGRAKGEDRLTWEQWAAIFNREKRHVVLTGGEPFLFPGLTKLINAIDSPMGVRVYSNFSLDISEFIAAVKRPCTFFVSWHAGQNVDRDLFWNNIQAVHANPLTALDIHCVDAVESSQALAEDRVFFADRGMSLPTDEDQRAFAGSDPLNGGAAWCSRRIYLLSPEGVRYQCVSKIMRRADPLEDSTKTPLGADRLLTLCSDWGYCAPCDGLGQSVVHAVRDV